jgi:hypothetical protein
MSSNSRGNTMRASISKEKSVLELKIYESKDKKYHLSLSMPRKGMILTFVVLILWRMPELWKLIETAKSLLGF